MGDKCQPLHCQYGAPSLHQENSPSYCRQQLNPHLNLGKKNIIWWNSLIRGPNSVLCQMPWTCAVGRKEAVSGDSRGKVKRVDVHPPTLIHTYRVGVILYIYADWEKSWKPGHGGWICKTTTKMRPARWYERSVFFTSNRCRLRAPCSLTHGYLMSTARLSGNLICWPTVVNKTSLQTRRSPRGFIMIWFDETLGMFVCFRCSIISMFGIFLSARDARALSSFYVMAGFSDMV